MRKRLVLLKQIKELTKNSEMTMVDAIALGRKVKKGAAKRLREKGLL